jgi:hypothetical protein
VGCLLASRAELTRPTYKSDAYPLTIELRRSAAARQAASFGLVFVRAHEDKHRRTNGHTFSED